MSAKLGLLLIVVIIVAALHLAKDVFIPIAEARVLPEPLTKSYEKLRAAWPS
jgi:hypothetical protein